MMKAGDFDRTISVQYRYATQDTLYGTPIVTWLTLGRYKAQVQDSLPSKSESVLQGLSIARSQTRIRMRYRDDIYSTMRILLHGDGKDLLYQIVGGPAQIQGRKQFMEMMCERYSDDMSETQTLAPEIFINVNAFYPAVVS